jgi:transposase
VETAVGTEGDPGAVSQVHQALAQRDLLPKEHLVDAGYGSGETVLTSETRVWRRTPLPGTTRQ